MNFIVRLRYIFSRFSRVYRMFETMMRQHKVLKTFETQPIDLKSHTIKKINLQDFSDGGLSQ
jgi:hypothetical protein